MSEKHISYEKRDHIGRITLNNPEEGNRINMEAAQELAEVCCEINDDRDVYVVVLTGAGDIFCSGWEKMPLLLAENNAELPEKYSPAEAIANMECPTIAALNGDAIGEGLELALACDLRIASDKARFGMPQITSGQIPMDGGTQRLSRIAGKGKALEMILTGEIINAQSAFETGLVNKVAGRDSLMSEVDEIAKTISGKAPFALRYAKEAVNKGMDMTLEQGLRLEADLYFLLHTTSDRTEGIQSFLEKKQPRYKGE